MIYRLPNRKKKLDKITADDCRTAATRAQRVPSKHPSAGPNLSIAVAAAVAVRMSHPAQFAEHAPVQSLTGNCCHNPPAVALDFDLVVARTARATASVAVVVRPWECSVAGHAHRSEMSDPMPVSSMGMPVYDHPH